MPPMIALRLQCPICEHKERMDVFGPLKTWEPIGGSTKSWKITTSVNQGGLVAAAAAVCPECNMPFGVLLRPGSSCSVQGLFVSGTSDQYDARMAGGKVTTIPTRADELRSEESLPEKIRSAFVFIQEDAKRRRNAPGILSGARGCLDVALKELGELKGTRRERLVTLSSRGIITTGIATWAQRLWEEGSDAVHDLDATIESAIEHVEFLKLFFEVAFALPAQIEAAARRDVEALIG